jgi:hypothetical protein
MGHIRLHRLPASRQWHQVVALLSGEADSTAIAGASATAAESSVRHAHDDSALAQSFWLLMRIPIAARSADFPRRVAFARAPCWRGAVAARCDSISDFLGLARLAGFACPVSFWSGGILAQLLPSADHLGNVAEVKQRKRLGG